MHILEGACGVRYVNFGDVNNVSGQIGRIKFKQIRAVVEHDGHNETRVRQKHPNLKDIVGVQFKSLNMHTYQREKELSQIAMYCTWIRIDINLIQCSFFHFKSIKICTRGCL